MTANTLTQVEQRIQLSGISWQTYKALLSELEAHHRRLRLIYNRGNLEIIAPSPERERYKEIVGRMVETLAEELDISIEPLGSTTFQRPEISGAEPDECFYIQNKNVVQGKKRIDLKQDPPPDLVVEIDITSRSESSLKVYADIGVPEIWIYNGKQFSIRILENQDYVLSDRSLAFPNLPLSEISRFLQQVGTVDYLQLIKEFRLWVQSQIQQK